MPLLVDFLQGNEELLVEARKSVAVNWIDEVLWQLESLSLEETSTYQKLLDLKDTISSETLSFEQWQDFVDSLDQ